MNTFKPGDLVLIVGAGENSACRRDIGKIATVNRSCNACPCGLMAELVLKLSFYQLNGFPNGCYREDALKKIDGSLWKTKTEDTRDAPVAA